MVSWRRRMSEMWSQKKNYPHTGTSNCFGCDDQGDMTFILTRRYGHQAWGKEDVEFFDSFFGYDTTTESARYIK